MYISKSPGSGLCPSSKFQQVRFQDFQQPRRFHRSSLISTLGYPSIKSSSYSLRARKYKHSAHQGLELEKEHSLNSECVTFRHGNHIRFEVEARVRRQKSLVTRLRAYGRNFLRSWLALAIYLERFFSLKGFKFCHFYFMDIEVRNLIIRIGRDKHLLKEGRKSRASNYV